MNNVIDIIIPVYKGFEELNRCIESVLGCEQKSPYQLILVNDASPEKEIVDYLFSVKKKNSDIILINNERNLGFVGSVNYGMSIHTDRDVVLLNSDTEVYGDWLDRMHTCAMKEMVSTVTPFSNNATICSYPVMCKENPKSLLYSGTDIDKAMSHINHGSYIEIPTGVGFCFYITRKSINAVGYFDHETYGRGYGEENDFCLRAKKKGFRNLLCCDTYVYHEGGVSFSDEQQQRVEKAQVILNKLYPAYHSDVQKFIMEDALEIFRLRAQCLMVREDKRQKILHITHHLSGGTQKHIHELFNMLHNDACFLLLKPYDKTGIELEIIDSTDWIKIRLNMPDDYPLLVEALKYLDISRIHFHHTYGLETSVWGLPDALGIPYDITLHDYYFINGNPSLTDCSGRYSTDLEVENGRYSRPVSLTVWQKNQSKLLDSANRVIAPSKATARIFKKHYPELRILEKFHPDWESDAPYPGVTIKRSREDASLRVLAIGALSLEKGAELLENVAVFSYKNCLPFTFELLGYACRPLADCIKVHGAYDDSIVNDLITKIDPDVIWFPALWPETYSYTLSEALRSGKPIIVPNIGAFVERIETRPFSWVCDWGMDIDAWSDQFLLVRRELKEKNEQVFLSWDNQPLPSTESCFYKNQYIQEDMRRNDCVFSNEKIDELMNDLLESSTRFSDFSESLDKRERVLRKLIGLRDTKIGRVISSFIPLNIQRKIKRKLSAKPIHEIR